jgi:DNA-binding NarL/FixJ family response regulator
VTIRVLLADDQALIRAGYRLILDSEPDITVVGEAANGREVCDLAHEVEADVILMDIRMPEMDGITATRHIVTAEDLVNVRILILTTFETDENVVLSLRAGAFLSPKATRGLVAHFLSQPQASAFPAATSLAGLTDREREVLALAAHGQSNDEIAERLHLSPLTAKTHVNRAMTKLGVRDRAQLVVIAYQSGLVRPGDPMP